MGPYRHEMHITSFPAGHVLSIDCWCEPAKIHWSKDENGPILIVEHQDDCQFHHKTMLYERSVKRDWITRILDAVSKES